MCGIVAVVRRRAQRTVPGAADVLDTLAPLAGRLGRPADDPAALARTLGTVAGALRHVEWLLAGVPGVQALLGDLVLASTVERHLAEIEAAVQMLEGRLDRDTSLSADELERTNAALVAVKDAAWSIRCDRLRTARMVAEMAGVGAGAAAVEAFTSVQVALSALDRLEVRGRDSAGLHLLVRGHGLDLAASAVAGMLDGRDSDPRFGDRSVRCVNGMVSFVYKAAAEIGELGDNTRALRRAITADDVLRLALAQPGAEVTVLGHTRWASVGIVSEANAHPLNSDESGRAGSYVVAAVNGDVDNYADLKAGEGLRIAAEITTDSKVVPTLVSRRLDDSLGLDEAFRRTVTVFEGSVAIAANAAAAPDKVLLALRGSGQALYVGLAEDVYVVASEPYGVVEETARYVRLDGETPANPENPNASRGQVFVLDGAGAGTLEGITRTAYDGTVLPVDAGDVVQAQITTRDIDRGGFPHFLLKEITEAPASFRKTLRGKLVERPGGDGRPVLKAEPGPGALTGPIRAALASGAVRRVVVIGQGTAAVAGQSLALMLDSMCTETPVRVEAVPATELSGFGLRDDMSDTLVIAISQSGTTTDTNRTVDLVRGRGASVIAIVNRRNSDLTDKVDGVLYTSDGRDVEMSVASTKAFYAQIAAGFVLATAIAEEVGGTTDPEVLAAVRDLPAALEAVLGRRADIAAAAQAYAPSRRHWAIVGNGSNRIAAAELRIKLSELCYKAIACDATEDKKHVDLSSEPMVIVCAAGLHGSTADDVAKEVAIYRAHQAAPIVIADDGEERFTAALAVLKVPITHPRLSFVLSVMVGHLFGYEAALAIDALARPLREARAAIEQALASADSGALRNGDSLLRRLRPAFVPLSARFFDGLRAGTYDGHLEASTAVQLASLFRYALGVTPLDNYQVEHGRIGTPAVVLDDLTGGLTQAIDELTRPIDAIKHQAKTVTVGISRADETLLQVPLAGAVLAAGAPRDALTYKVLRALADLDPTVEEVLGSTRYRIEGDPAMADDVAAFIVDKRGIAADIPSRTERDPVLRGTKRTVAAERELFVTKGRRDGRTIVIVPETRDNQTVGLTVLHVRFEDRLPVAAARGALQGYRNRYTALRDAVTETEGAFREDRMAELPVVDLLTLPITELADRWRP